MATKTPYRWLAVTLVLACAASLDAREWTVVAEGKKYEGDFVKVADDRVHVRVADGQTITLPLAELSAADRDYVEAIGKVADVTSAEMAVIETDDPNQVGTVRTFGDLGWAIKSLAFSPNGVLLAAGKMDRAVLLFEVNAGLRLTSLTQLEALGQVTAVAFAPGGNELLTAGDQGLIQIWKVSPDGTLTSARQFAGHTAAVKSLCISNDGAFVLSGCSDKTVRYWDLATCKQAFATTGFKHPVQGVFISAKRGQGLAYDGEKLSLLNLNDGTVMQTMALPYSSHGAAISPDGKYVAVGDGYLVRVFDIRQGDELKPLRTGQTVWSAIFTPNGRYLLTGERGQVSLWEVATGTRLHVFGTQGSYYVQSLAVSPDGRHFAAIPGSAGQKLEVMRMPAAVQAAE